MSVTAVFSNGKTFYQLVEFVNCENEKDIKYLWDGILKTEEDLNKIGFFKLKEESV